MRSVLLLVALVGAFAGWVQMESDVQVSEKAPRNWVNRGVPAPTDSHSVIFALKHDAAKLKELDRIFWEVSDPQHKNYGKYLTFEESNQLMAAPQAHIDIVGRYLTSFGVSGKLNPNQDMMKVDAPVATLEKMLNTKLGKYERTFTGEIIIRASQAYYLPEEVAACVDVVGNLLDFPNWGRLRYADAEVAAKGGWPNYCGTTCAGYVVPQVVQQQYNSSNLTPSNKKNSISVAEFGSQNWDAADLNAFTSACGFPAETVMNKVDSNSGSCPTSFSCDEALLDLEYIHAVAPNDLTVYDYYLKTGSILNWIDDLLADANASLVSSISYGGDENQQSSTYMQQCNTQFQAAASRGLSILFAAGDDGVWGIEGASTGTFNPDFPAGSPYVTAVGGTDYSGTNINIGSPQMCATKGGGGFSQTFTQPSYQSAAVAAYLSNPAANLPPSNLYNSKGRAYPDISALFGAVVPYCIHSGGGWVEVYGTSASTPVTAGIIANLNNIQLNAGKPQLGFLNPWLYQTLAANPSAFYDVTTGTNNNGLPYGFTAVKGWDPCSGVGTPLQGMMAKYLP
jgi:tripeptidyl-peptidase-1